MILTNDEIIAYKNYFAEDLKKRYGHNKRFLGESGDSVDDGVPILEREFPFSSDYKINNKLPFDFFGKMILLKTGYLFGLPIVTNYEDPEKTVIGKVIDKIKFLKLTNNEIINRWKKEVNFNDIITETGKTASTCGYGVVQAYLDDNQDSKQTVYLKELNPWEVIFIGDINDPDAVLRVYSKVDIITKKKTEYIDYIDRKEWIKYEITGATLKELPNQKYNSKGELITLSNNHGFNQCPVVAFSNNKELMGDVDKVLHLIDDYDRNLSDLSSEIEQFSLALLIIWGVDETGETFNKKAKKTGVLSFPDKDGKAEYVTKNLDIEAVKFRRETLNEDIYDKANIPNMTDSNFIGNSSGVALKYKMLGLESISALTELKFQTGLARIFSLLFYWWSFKDNLKLDYLNMKYIFTRNYPMDIESEAKVLETLQGKVSDETRFSVSKIIDDPEKEKARIEADKEELTKFNSLDDDDEVVE